jgi:hypothetical protein
VCQKQEESSFLPSGPLISTVCKPIGRIFKVRVRSPMRWLRILTVQRSSQCRLGQWTPHVGPIEIAGNTRVLERDRRDGKPSQCGATAWMS